LETAKIDPRTGEPLEEMEVIPTKGLPLNSAVKRILGKKDTRVRLTVLREGSDKPLEFDVTRGAVATESVLGVKRKADDEWDFPMVCMVNGYTASGSEIVTAALQDHKRAYIIGERSYGKGSVQNTQDFDGGQIKLTTASFWRPSGKNLNKSSTDGKDEDEWGVVPDLAVKLSRKEREDLAEAQHKAQIIPRKDGKAAKDPKTDFKDRQLEAALEYLRGRID